MAKQSTAVLIRIKNKSVAALVYLEKIMETSALRKIFLVVCFDLTMVFCGGNSVVECLLAKEDAVGSSPIRRSISLIDTDFPIRVIQQN